MYTYIVFLLLVMISLIPTFKYSQTRLISIIIIIIFSGFRYDVGMDYNSYEAIFYGKFINIDGIELGYKILNKIIKLLNLNFQGSILIVTIIINFLFYNWINNNSKNYFLSILVYLCTGIFFLNSLNAIRQFIAIALFLNSLNYLKQKKRLKNYLFIILGSLFHSSCILMILLYDILNREIKKKYYLLALISVFIMIKYNIFNKILSLLPKYNVYATFLFIPKIGYTYYILFLLLLVIIFMKDSKYLKNNKLEVDLFFIGGLIMISSFNVSILYRLSYYFLPTLIILIPNSIAEISEKKIRINILYIVMLILILIYSITLSKGVDYKLIPYKMKFRIFE